MRNRLTFRLKRQGRWDGCEATTVQRRRASRRLQGRGRGCRCPFPFQGFPRPERLVHAVSFSSCWNIQCTFKRFVTWPPAKHIGQCRSFLDFARPPMLLSLSLSLSFSFSFSLVRRAPKQKNQPRITIQSREKRFLSSFLPPLPTDYTRTLVFNFLHAIT